MRLNSTQVKQTMSQIELRCFPTIIRQSLS